MRHWANSFAQWFVLSAAFFVFASGSVTATSSLVTAIVTDPLTGVALDGYDVVSYITEDVPLLGVPAFEFTWGGVPWYFATAANRDVFVKSPETYAPMFGGYGTIALSRGYLSAGNPRVYLVLGDRLFVFYSSGNREAFLVAPRKAFGDAEQHWKDLLPGLTQE